MKIYSVKIALRGVSPMIWRRLRIPGSTSIAELHQIIQTLFGWDDDHLHLFHIYGKDYGIAYLGGMTFSDDPHSVYLDDFEFDVGDRFSYEYNFYEAFIHDIRIEKIETTATSPTISPSHIFCTKGNGMPGATKYDEYERTMEFMQAIVDADESTTVGDLQEVIDALNAVRFNRQKVNRDLADISSQLA